jgi:dTDP-4-amino-4,6-dideoxygalactose transaminase
MALMARLREAGILAPFHYVPLHSAPTGRRFGRAAGPMPVTDADRLLRLPLWHDMTDEPDFVIESIRAFLR